MIVLEKSDEFHRHVDECVVCTAGCREAIFCVRGWRLLLGAMDEAFSLAERGVAANLAALPPAIAAAETALRRQPASAVERQKPAKKPAAANGVTASLDKLRSRMGNVQELAPSDAGSSEAE